MADVKMCSRSVSRTTSVRYESPVFKMFDRIGSHLTQKELQVLKLISGIDDSLKKNIKNGKDFFRALTKSGSCDESNFTNIVSMLKFIKRQDLLHVVHIRKKRKVAPDPVEEYLKTIEDVPQDIEQVAGPSHSNRTLRISSNDAGPSTSSDDKVSFGTDGTLPSRRLRRSQRICNDKRSIASETDESSFKSSGMRKLSCDVRLRVRAEYCNYETALHGSVSSNKADPLERQLDCFAQANNILRSRDLGYIVCDIKFSEITYLDAFWRDYLNGSLLEALKGVFITDTLKQAVGNEAIKLLVNVEENDYEKGRSILLKNLTRSA